VKNETKRNKKIDEIKKIQHAIPTKVLKLTVVLPAGDTKYQMVVSI
jgi:transcriptional regulator of met regulon